MFPHGSNHIAPLNRLVDDIVAQGLGQVVDEDVTHHGGTVTVHGKKLANFGSCGYMSLEFDPRVRQGGIDAIQRYGMQFSSSRAYLSNPLYPQLENLLDRVFGLPTLLAPTTTLAHLAALPVLVGPADVVLVDQQVHSSVQLAVQVLRASGVAIDIVPHSNIAAIERKIKAYRGTKKKIWYLGDGVYSMYGDFAPVGELMGLLQTYEQFYLYLDDAHGMSWTGKHGRGHVLSTVSPHPRLIVVAGLSKGFGAGGAVIVCPGVEIKQVIRNCGGTQIFSGPLQPPLLGAAIASAKIHLSDAFPQMQEQLGQRVDHCVSYLSHQPLPMIGAASSPIRFLGIGSINAARAVVKGVIADGFWVNLAQFPAVAPNHAGLRFMLTRQASEDDIAALAASVAKHADRIIGRDNDVLAKIWKAFRMRREVESVARPCRHVG